VERHGDKEETKSASLCRANADGTYPVVGVHVPLHPTLMFGAPNTDPAVSSGQLVQELEPPRPNRPGGQMVPVGEVARETQPYPGAAVHGPANANGNGNNSDTSTSR
jgi:hypothetical protein